MKRILFLSVFFLIAVISMSGQTERRSFAFTATAGSRISFGSPPAPTFTFHIQSHYRILNRFWAGVGSGLSLYDKIPLIPLYGTARFNFTKPNTIVPYMECSVGYSFAAGTNCTGGFYLYPSVGAQWHLSAKFALQAAIGYELQNLRRLKRYSDSYFLYQFKENIAFNSVTFRIGISF